MYSKSVVREALPIHAELCPVKFDLGPADELVDVKIRVGSEQSQAVGFGDSINKIRGNNMTCAGHVLHHHIGTARNILSHMRRDHARINIEKVTGLAARNNRDCLALIIRGLRGGMGNRPKQN